MKIDHIAIWADDIELLRKFYMRYFNMTCNDKYVNTRKNFSSYFLSFSEGGARLEIMNIPGKDAPAGRGNLKGLAHFTISVGSKENVDDMARKFKEDGVVIITSPAPRATAIMNVSSPTPKGTM